jgi:alkylation response protein AidB-like acyl-CoA dehydrogenase
MGGLFGRTEEHAMLHDMLRRFVRENSDLEHRNLRLHGPAPARMALWPGLVALGAFAAGVAEAHGGVGGSIRDVAVVQDALAEGLIVEPVLATAMAARLLSNLAAPDALLAALLGGEKLFVLAHAEGFDPFAPPLATAVPAGGGYRLNGWKPCVRHADVATTFLLSACLPDGEVAVFLVEADTPGLSATKARLIDAAGAADLLLSDAAVPLAARLELAADPMGIITDALEWGLGALCAEAAALTQIANQATYDYLNLREQFGVRLAQFQALQHRVADMAIAQEEATAMAEAAIDALQRQPSADRSCAVLAASLACDAASRRVAHESVQMFGGMGVSDELAVSHYARRFAAIRAQIGTTDARAARLTALEAALA